MKTMVMGMMMKTITELNTNLSHHIQTVPSHVVAQNL